MSDTLNPCCVSLSSTASIMPASCESSTTSAIKPSTEDRAASHVDGPPVPAAAASAGPGSAATISSISIVPSPSASTTPMMASYVSSFDRRFTTLTSVKTLAKAGSTPASIRVCVKSSESEEMFVSV